MSKLFKGIRWGDLAGKGKAPWLDDATALPSAHYANKDSVERSITVYAIYIVPGYLRSVLMGNSVNLNWLKFVSTYDLHLWSFKLKCNLSRSYLIVMDMRSENEISWGNAEINDQLPSYSSWLHEPCEILIWHAVDTYMIIFCGEIYARPTHELQSIGKYTS